MKQLKAFDKWMCSLRTRVYAMLILAGLSLIESAARSLEKGEHVWVFFLCLGFIGLIKTWIDFAKAKLIEAPDWVRR